MTQEAESEDPISGWAVFEAVGHRVLAGQLSTVQIGGAALIRIDAYTDGDQAQMTQFYGVNTVYCISPSTEEVCRGLMRKSLYKPVARYQLELSDEPPAPPYVRYDDDPSDWCEETEEDVG